MYKVLYNLSEIFFCVSENIVDGIHIYIYTIRTTYPCIPIQVNIVTRISADNAVFDWHIIRAARTYLRRILYNVSAVYSYDDRS